MSKRRPARFSRSWVLELIRGLGLPEASSDTHPLDRQQLIDFMAVRLDPEANRRIVRHLLTGCPGCTSITREIWSLGSERMLDPDEASLSDVDAGLAD